MIDIRFEMVIYWNKRNKSFLVEGLELPSFLDGGQTYEEAIQNDLNSAKSGLKRFNPLCNQSQKVNYSMRR